MDIIQFSESELIQWLKKQLEKRETGIYKKAGKEEIRKELYKIMFYEQGITVEEIERFFIPFHQAGYLTSRQKFEIILFVLEKNYGNSMLFLSGAEECYVVTEEDIDALYLQWSLEERLYLSEEERKDFFIQTLMDGIGLGVWEVLKRVAPDGILLGELCPAVFETEAMEQRIAVYSRGAVIHLPFLKLGSKEELIRIIKSVVALENKGELTMMEPMLDFVREDGTCITAVRPPAVQDWGIRMLYGAARKEGARWRK